MNLRKLMSGALAAFALAAGLITISSTPASAATRASIVSIAQAELNNASRNHGAGPIGQWGVCNFYTGYFRTWKPATASCPTTDGVRWRESDWCADFAKYVWLQAGVTHANIPEGSGGPLTGNASSFKGYGTTYGTWHARTSGYTPQPGDAVVFDWGGDGVIDHVGIVTSANSSTVYTIEGNAGSSSRTLANSYSRSYTSIVGYSEPLGVTGGSTTPPPPPPNTKYWVDTFAAAPGYSSPGGIRTGTLNAGTNYVFCKVWGPNVQVGSDYNHWWLKTDLDSGSPWQNQYVSAYYLSRWGNDVAKDNSGVVIPDC
ncbi:CHAP domain-containing protein [Acrocarpospora catenulata]|uniref:CHAP domain-containing protein n=1 Tax=Acrocarpospora catenulata TaxID=2836182 RepID=UPI001BDB0AB4|nr:CHAP domain-containing protein [Acrocarpospora catenulata]